MSAHAATLLETRRSVSRRSANRRPHFFKVLFGPSLCEELQAKGVDVIPYDMVKTYQKEVLKKRMATANFWHRHHLISATVQLAGFIGFCVFVIGFVALSLLGKFAMIWPLFLSVAMAVLFLKAIRFLFSDRMYGATGIYWKTEPLHYVLTVPEEYENDVRNAQKIPGTKVYIQTFETDPFIFVEKRGWTTIQRAYIACWDCPGFKWDKNRRQ